MIWEEFQNKIKISLWASGEISITDSKTDSINITITITKCS